MRRQAGKSPEIRRGASKGRTHARPAFSDLVEYKKIETHRVVGEQLGIRDPFYRAHGAAAGATALVEGRRMLNFASYDYLGLNQHPAVIDAAKAALDRYAVSASASRFVGGERLIHQDLEQQIASIYDTEAALVFVSGYLTNVTAISCLMGPEDLVLHDEFIHNSAIAGIKLSGATRRFFRHNDIDALRRLLEESHGRFRRILVLVEGLYSMDGDVARLPGILALREEFGFWLMVDEAHALGILGNRGLGSREHHALGSDDVDIWMGTLSKTSSACGGYIAGSSALIAILRAYAGGFVYSVGLPPVLAGAALASLRTMLAEPERTRRLRSNALFFRERARNAGLNTGLSEGHAVVPIMVGDSVKAAKLSDDLFSENINVLPIIYPAVPEGHARLRFFITSEHSHEQLEEAVTRTAACLARLDQSRIGMDMLDMAAILRQVG